MRNEPIYKTTMLDSKFGMTLGKYEMTLGVCLFSWRKDWTPWQARKGVLKNDISQNEPILL